MTKKLFTKNNKSLNNGFTLVELLVTIVIFVVITGVVLMNSNSFNNTVLLRNFAYDVALTIKQAQSYGVNVRESNSGLFNTAYGIYFDTGTGGDRTKFVLFNDTGSRDTYDFNTASTPDQVYNGSLTSCPTDDPECIQRFSMTRGTYVKSMCAGTDINNCDIVDQLSILFRRPSLEAKIYINNESAVTVPTPNNKAYAKITLGATDGSEMEVVVTSIGQIYVKK